MVPLSILDLSPVTGTSGAGAAQSRRSRPLTDPLGFKIGNRVLPRHIARSAPDMIGQIAAVTTHMRVAPVA